MKPDSPQALIAHLNDEIHAVLRPHLRGVARVALLDFPRRGNVGDSAIWLGELRYLLTRTQAEVVYSSDASTYSRAQLARRIGDGTILITGGGNVGDLWEWHQLFRERVIADFPDNPIVQLPASIHFAERAALDRARQAFRAHPQLTLLLRDHASHTLADTELGVPTALCPDMAFCLGYLGRRGAPTRATLRLMRADLESRAVPAEPAIDWTLDDRSVIRLVNRALSRLARSTRTRVPGLRRLLSAANTAFARQRLARGLALLNSTESLVTDRLHGHILAILADVPHDLVDTRTGKIKNFLETWTSGCRLVRSLETAPGTTQRALG